jgi:hypothetical protein
MPLNLIHSCYFYTNIPIIWLNRFKDVNEWMLFNFKRLLVQLYRVKTIFICLWDGAVHFVLDRPTELDLNSDNSLEQQCTYNMSLHWAQYTDSEPTNPCLYSLPLCVYITFIVFGLTPCLSNTRSTTVDLRHLIRLR